MTTNYSSYKRRFPRQHYGCRCWYPCYYAAVRGLLARNGIRHPSRETVWNVAESGGVVYGLR